MRGSEAVVGDRTDTARCAWCDASGATVIAVRLTGGLGNQMFQYAVGRRLADVRQTELVLDLSHLASQPATEVPREFELDCFPIRSSLSHARIPTAWPLVRPLGHRQRPTLVREKRTGFDPDVLVAPDNSLLVGYWQSEKYFVDHEAEIRNDFQFIMPLGHEKHAVADTIDERFVSVHIRRGDFVSHPASNAFHGTVPMSYYHEAASLLAKTVPDVHFLVLSDDSDWCRQHVDLGHETTIVDSRVGRGYEDMMLMSMCRHHIIANSTFGWWGAWLGNNPDKTVAAPKKWFVSHESDIEDRVPRAWITL